VLIGTALCVIIKMTIQNFKFISYNGGSAGDLFTVSCNGHRLNPNSNNQIIPNANGQSIKTYEPDLLAGKIDLPSVLAAFSPGYISTHQISLIERYQGQLVNIVIDDPDVQDITIFRQMQLQTLRISVDHTQHWFLLVKSLCKKGKFEEAADCWFRLARDLWKKQMADRIKSAYPSVNFNQLFTDSASKSIEQQGWTHNIEIFDHNHQIWFQNNQNFSKTKTIQSMAHKLAAMPWDQESGVVSYVLLSS